MKHLKFLLIALMLIFSCLMPLRAQAAGASMTMTANSTTVASGATVIVAVYVNGGGNNVNTVQANISYPASKLQYVGVSYTGSAFSISTPDNGGSGGLVAIANGTITPITGSGLLATITFRALADSGTAELGFAGGSALIYDNAEVPSAKSGLTLTLGSPAPRGGGQAAARAVPEAPQDTAAPKITVIKPKGVTPYAANITWATDEPADSTVEYGLDEKYGLSAGSNDKTTAHEVAFNSSFLTPKTVLHYRVKSVDASGNATVSPDQTLQLPGVPVTVIVRGSDGQPRAGADVTLDNQTVTTGSDGKAVFSVSLGNKQVVTNIDGVTIRRGVTIGKTEKPLPAIELAAAQQPTDRWMLTSISLLIVVFLLLAFDALLFGSKFFRRLVYRHSYVLQRASSPRPAPPVTRMPLSASPPVPDPLADHEVPVINPAPVHHIKVQ